MRILIIEDEQKMAEILKRGLEEENFTVEIANDGDTGLTIGKEQKFDVILLDVTLPGMDGFDVAKELRATNIKTPILMLTARDSTEMKVRGLDSGADEYITKPFAFAELLARIRAQVRRSEDITKLQIGDLHLDLIHRKVTRGGEEVQLTGMKYSSKLNSLPVS